MVGTEDASIVIIDVSHGKVRTIIGRCNGDLPGTARFPSG